MQNDVVKIVFETCPCDRSRPSSLRCLHADFLPAPMLCRIMQSLTQMTENTAVKGVMQHNKQTIAHTMKQKMFFLSSHNRYLHMAQPCSTVVLSEKNTSQDTSHMMYWQVIISKEFNTALTMRRVWACQVHLLHLFEDNWLYCSANTLHNSAWSMLNFLALSDSCKSEELRVYKTPIKSNTICCSAKYTTTSQIRIARLAELPLYCLLSKYYCCKPVSGSILMN